MPWFIEKACEGNRIINIREKNSKKKRQVNKYMNIKEEGKKIWQIRKKINRKHIIVLSFFMPLIVMIGCCIAFGVQPFGDNSLLIIDGLHQYMPF